MGSRDILALLLLQGLVVTRARRPGSTFYRRLMLHVALGLGKDPAGMQLVLVTRAKDTLAGADMGSRRSLLAPRYPTRR